MLGCHMRTGYSGGIVITADCCSLHTFQSEQVFEVVDAPKGGGPSDRIETQVQPSASVTEAFGHQRQRFGPFFKRDEAARVTSSDCPLIAIVGS